MLIVDFNNTLLNTPKFKSALVESLSDLGVEQDLFWSTYPQVFQYRANSFGYNFDDHLSILEKSVKLDKKVAQQKLFAVLARAKDFLFDDAIDFLERVSRVDQDLILLCRGKDKFEHSKLKHSRIDKFFKEVYITDQNKTEIMADLVEKEIANKNIFFINDHLKENLEIVKKFPQVKVILKRRSDINYNTVDLKKMLALDSLKEIADFIVNFYKINWRELV